MHNPSPMTPVGLRCEYFENTLGLDEPQPRLSWQCQRQTAYQIRVVAGWDTGKVVSDASTHVEYRGPALRSRQRYIWQVRVWDADDRPSPWSESAGWEMGLLKRSDWKAKWIGCDTPCPQLRKNFALGSRIARARIYVTALGLYELWINNQRVGADYFTPGWTDYTGRVQYQTYDVTSLLREGGNVLGAIIGGGWFTGAIAWRNERHLYGHPPRLLAQLEVTDDDGRVETIATDASWESAAGPILESDIYNGETYDARRQFGDGGWQPVKIFDAPRVTLNASASPRVRQIQELKPQRMTEPKPGTFVFDLGQNMVGWARLAVNGPAGTTVTLRFAEVLNPDGTIYTTNLRAAKCTDRYTLRGGGTEVYEPRFTFHGFRYVEVTGGKPESVTGVVLHTDIRPTGSFACSHPMLNQLQHNIVWGQKGNFLEVPTDCPQRDERLGWTGDAQVFCRTACFNADVAGFFTKWLADLADAQSTRGAFPMVAPVVWRARSHDGGPAWADAGLICPWTIYLCYGDRRILERHYDAMRRYLDFLDATDYKSRHCFGDWLNIQDDTPKDLIALAFNAHAAQLMIKIAEVSGRKKDAARFRTRLQRAKVEFNREFVTPTGRLVGGSQTAYVLALQFDLLPPAKRRQAAARLVQRIHECKDHLSTGFVGTPYLLHVLQRFGHLDLAYQLLLNEDFPSWGYPIKHGATTMWEHWDGWRHDKGFQDPGMNSFNHYAYGAVGDWMYQTILGIQLDELQPGYKHFFIAPVPGGGLTWARGEYQSIHGPIRSAWKIERGRFALEVTVPGNTTATVQLPGPRQKPRRIGPGSHRFESKL